MDPSLIEVFVFENMQLLEQLEKTLLAGEKNKALDKDQINEVFRVMHTIKGSASMMEFSNLAKYAHALEDLFDYIRSNSLEDPDVWEDVFDAVLNGIDYFKEEIAKLQNGEEMDGDMSDLYDNARRILGELKNDGTKAAAEKADGQSENTTADETRHEAVGELEKKGPFTDADMEEFSKACEGGTRYMVRVEFEQGCGMETIRALSVVTALKGSFTAMRMHPVELEEDHDREIAENGLYILIETDISKNELWQKVEQVMFVSAIEVEPIDEVDKAAAEQAAAKVDEAPAQSQTQQVAKAKAKPSGAKPSDHPAEKPIKQNFISINVNKIDRLMNLVGEIVTTESMVTKNPDLDGLNLENFQKQARQLRKLTNELQDVVMSIRMVPISSAFNKMQRIVRDMSKKINKEADLVIIGETTEVDKNVIECLSDPLMHLIRNSMDHGLESPEERIAAGKPERGTITLEAYNTGGDVIVSVSDDGRGLDKSSIVKKAQDMGLTTKTEDELTDGEAYSFILEPGFSTNKEITEYSGRGVGMDVVHKNIESINGTISIDSKPGQGMINKIHIPLTLSIVEGMVVSVGKEQYIIPILSIRESFEARLQQIFIDPNGVEMVIIRGECYRIMSLARMFNIETENHGYEDGIMVMIETELGAACLFVDKLLGEQQAVIKPIPEYIMRHFGRVKGISGCTVLGDGSISMILDTNALITLNK